MEIQVPFNDLWRIHEQSSRDFTRIFEDALRESAFIGGNSVASFEKSISNYAGCKYAVACSSGTSALTVGLLAMKYFGFIEKRVFVQGNSFQASAEAVVIAGMDVCLFDVNPALKNPDMKIWSDLLAAKKEKDGIMVVHMNGCPVDLDLEQHDFLIEDASQALGSSYKDKRKIGGLGKFAALSFYPGKNLGGFGDGGCILTNDSEFSKVARSIVDHGKLNGRHRLHGGTFRLDSIQAAILELKLQNLDKHNEMRKIIADYYNENLKGDIVLPVVPKGTSSNWHIYPIRVLDSSRRDEIRAKLLDEFGIQTGIHYEESISQTGVFGTHQTPNCDELANSMISLPIFPLMLKREAAYVAESLNKCLL